MSENTSSRIETSHNFAPSIPNELLPKGEVLVPTPGSPERAGLIDRFKSSFVSAKSETVIPAETTYYTDMPKDRAEELYGKLLDRVDILTEIHRYETTPSASGDKNKKSPLTSSEMIALVKAGKAHNLLTDLESQSQNGEDYLKERLDKVEDSIRFLAKNPDVRAEYKKLREERVDKLRRAKQVNDNMELVKALKLREEKIARKAFLERRRLGVHEESQIQSSIELINVCNSQSEGLLKDPEVISLVRMQYLQELQRGLKKDRFAETPSRQELIDRVRRLWAQGERVLLTGPTGGGKTELLKYASRSLFGEDPEVVRGHELITPYEIYGKMGGGLQEGVATIVFKAAAAVRALRKNVPIIIDEANLIPNRILMRMKADWNAKVGDKITIQEDSDEEITVGDRFAWGATANVKSEKHPDREKIDPAVVRMFETIITDYMPPHEVYDILLASQLDLRGGMKMSVQDAAVTLKALCDSSHWIQKAYQGERVDVDANNALFARDGAGTGKLATIREAVLDPSRVIGMLNGWEESRAHGFTLREHLNKRIIDFINNENFPEEDRYYLVEIFGLKGFLQGVYAGQLKVANINQQTLDAWNGYDGKRYVSKVNYIPPETVAKLDPYGKFQSTYRKDIADLLDEDDEVGEEVVMESSKIEDVNPFSTSHSSQRPPGRAASRIGGAGATAKTEAGQLFNVSNPISDLPTTDLERGNNAGAYTNFVKNAATVAKSDPNSCEDVAIKVAQALQSVELPEAIVYNIVDQLIQLAQNARTPAAKLAIATAIGNINKMQSWKNDSGGLSRYTIDLINQALAIISK